MKLRDVAVALVVEGGRLKPRTAFGGIHGGIDFDFDSHLKVVVDPLMRAIFHESSPHGKTHGTLPLPRAVPSIKPRDHEGGVAVSWEQYGR